VRFILNKTLGRVPVFTELSPEFQMAVFPVLKPLAVAPGDIVFRKGDVSKDLCFLISGDVDVLSELDDETAVRRLRCKETAILSPTDHREELVVSPSLGCFGQSVLVGRRRPETHRGFSPCELLIIAKKDLEELFAANPHSARRICNVVLKGYFAQERLRSLAAALRIAAMPFNQTRVVLQWQYAWRRYADEMASETDALYRLVLGPSPRRRLISTIQQEANGYRKRTAKVSDILAVQQSLTSSAMLEQADMIGTRTPTAAPVARDTRSDAAIVEVVKPMFDAMMRRMANVENKLDAIFKEVQIPVPPNMAVEPATPDAAPVHSARSSMKSRLERTPSARDRPGEVSA